MKDVAEQLYNCKDKVGRRASLLAEDIYKIICENHEAIDAAIRFERDFTFDYFGFKTLERAYLLKGNLDLIQLMERLWRDPNICL